MNEPNEHLGGGSEPSIPPSLADDLSALYGAGVPVPSEMDAAIGSVARARLAGPRRSRMVLRLVRAVAAAAAAIALAVWYVLPDDEDGLPAQPVAAAVAREDIDRNGSVDILDAFALARHIEAADALRDEWDINRDGTIDKADVNAIALSAVRLDRG